MKEFDQLISIIRKLRGPGGCPWDKAQKLENYKKFLLEEAYELVDEMDNANPEAIKEELGDLFLILAVITEMLREKGEFDCKGVLEGINRKLIYRHPHVYASKKLGTKEEVLKYWTAHKAKKKKRKVISDRLPRMAPALFLADMFFKEYSHIREAKPVRVEERLILKEIFSCAAALQKSKATKTAFSGLLFALARLGFTRQVDLEGLLRKKVFSEARRVRYRHK
jgi:tetrapyrrole methylase family protein / MazG family protein